MKGTTMKRRFLTGLLCVILTVSSILSLVSCGEEKKSQSGNVETTVIDMSLEDAKAKVSEAGGIPVVADIYDADKEDAALLSIGDFAADVKEGDYVTIFRNNLGIKDQVMTLTVTPVIIEKSSFEEKIYNKISNDNTLKMTFDTYYTLIESETATSVQKKTYPILEEMSIYVLDTSASVTEKEKIAGYISENTDYSAEDMFNDYLKVGVIPAASEKMEAAVVDSADLTTEDVDGGIAITGYAGSLQNIVVPAEIDGKPVVELAKGAFPQSTIHAVTVLNGTETIATGAFSGAYGIYNIYLPDSVSSVEENAFSAALLSNQTEEGLVYLGSEQDLVISYIGVDAELTVPEGVRFLGGGFARDNKTMTSVSLPEGLLSIGVEAFRECKVLTTYNIPSTVTRICEGAFRTTRHLTVIDIPASVTAIDDYAFFETNDVVSITIGENVKTIGMEAFDYNLLVTDIHIPSSVEYIGANAFLKCLALTSVTGGENITYVGSRAFDEDPWYVNLCHGTDSPFGFLSENGKILILYDATEGEVTVPDGVVCLSSAFQNVAAVKKVIINDGCEIITDYAFASCSGLKDIVIPASVTTIEGHAFDNITDRITIHCEAGSYAEEFAKKNLIAYDNNIG